MGEVAKLPLRQERFAREVARDLADRSRPARPLYEAHKAAGLCGDRSSAAKLYKRPEVQARIGEHMTELMDASDITPDKLKQSALDLFNDKDTPPGAKVRVLELLMKSEAMLVQVNREDAAAGLSDHELAKNLSGYDPEQPERGGNKVLYDETLREMGARREAG